VPHPSENSHVFLCGLVAHLTQAGFIVLSEGASRLGDSLLPKRAFKGGFAVSLNSSPR